MTLDNLAHHFQYLAGVWVGILENVADQIGQDAVRVSRAKLGEYQPPIGFFPGWESLADSTLAEKARLGLPSPSPLLRTGDLRDSISFDTNVSASSATVNLYSTSDYAPVQELGGGPSNIPPRPFIGPVPFERQNVWEYFVGSRISSNITPGLDASSLVKMKTMFDENYA
jgi:hypothetical protein